MSGVSIVIPAFKPRHFEVCLASAVAQTFQDIEIIVSDDCPTDDIRQICDKFPGRINYSRNPNPGARSNFLRVASLAQKEYIKFLFDDDVLNPFCVQYLRQGLEMTKHNNTSLAFSPRGTIDIENNTTGMINLLEVSGWDFRIFEGPEIISLIASNCLNPIGEFSTVMMRKKDTLSANGREFIDLPGSRSVGLGDIQAWINLCQKGNVVAHPHVLSYFRMQLGTNSDPATNRDFIYAVSEWQDVVNFAASTGYLQGENLIRAYQTVLSSLQSWLPKFPALADNIKQVQSRLASLMLTHRVS